MSELTITLTGEIQHSNFDEWKNDLVKQVRSVKQVIDENDDMLHVAENVRQFRVAERTLRDAKAAALEQAADINRLFDAVDAITEETRQVRLSLERQMRARKLEEKQKALEKRMEENAETLSQLPETQQLLFQDKSTLLALPAEELAAVIDERVSEWESSYEEHSQDGHVSGSADGAFDEEHEAIDHAELAQGAEYSQEQAQTWLLSLGMQTNEKVANELYKKINATWGKKPYVNKIVLKRDDA